jgi:acyl-CoA oxidase
MARGLTIAIRYCAVRCQFNDNPNQNGETQVLDYSMVQYRLLTLLAESVALNFTGQATIAFHDETKQALQAGNSGNNANSRKEMFAELHASSCALKAFATSAAAQGLEICRRACGGHGYSSFAGIGNVFADYVASQTYEGDNYVLGQQTANYVWSPIDQLNRTNTTRLPTNFSLIASEAGTNSYSRKINRKRCRKKPFSVRHSEERADSVLLGQ